MHHLQDTKKNRALLAADPNVSLRDASAILGTREKPIQGWCDANKVDWAFDGPSPALEEEEDRFEESDLTPEQKASDAFFEAKERADIIRAFWSRRGAKIRIFYVPEWNPTRQHWNRFDVRSDLLNALPRPQ